MLCLGLHTAIQCWQSCGFPASDTTLQLPNHIPRLDETTERRLIALGTDTSRVQCVVTSPAARRRSQRMDCLVWSAPSHVPICQEVTRDVYACIPEAAFVQIAGMPQQGRMRSRVRSAGLPRLLQLVMLGYEMCGTYALNGGGSGFREAAPILSVNRLAAFLDLIPGRRGIDLARRALPLIAEGSASPMETALTMLLSLPQAYGGYGFPTPVLNKELRIETANDIWHSGRVICDLFWPQYSIVLEYDSNEFHTGAQRINRDSVRRTALSNAGIEVISVTAGQIASEERARELAMLVAKKMERRLRIHTQDWEARHSALRSVLFPWGV